MSRRRFRRHNIWNAAMEPPPEPERVVTVAEEEADDALIELASLMSIEALHSGDVALARELCLLAEALHEGGDR